MRRNKAGILVGTDLTITVVTTDVNLVISSDENVMLPAACEHKKRREIGGYAAELI
jgi:hypothetical protein